MFVCNKISHTVDALDKRLSVEFLKVFIEKARGC